MFLTISTGKMTLKKETEVDIQIIIRIMEN